MNTTEEPKTPALLFATGVACCALEVERDDGTENMLIRAEQKAKSRKYEAEPVRITEFGGLE